VAALAGVSTATVSRALHGAGQPVSPATRDRVAKAARRLHYRANHVARSLKTRSTRTIAILAPELANEFFMELAEGMERELGRSGYTLIVASSGNSAEEEVKRLAVLSERLVDGVVVIPAGGRGDHLRELADRGIPVVLVDRLVEGAALDAVLSDNEGGAAALTRALLADGFRRIAFLGGDPAISTARERLAGYTRALKEAGLPVREDDLYLGGMGIEDGFRRMDELLARPEPPEALLAVNLLVHLGAQRRLLAATDRTSADPGGAARRSGPAIAAFDETPYSAFLPACRYTAAQDAAGLGAAAARRILGRIDSGGAGGAPAEIIRLPVAIISHQRG
jgi:LacI family transcriptional regulator